MASAAITLSGDGQIEIPKEILQALNWHAGTELVLVSKPGGVTISTVDKSTRRRFADLIGLLKHEGPALSDEALCAVVGATVLHTLDRDSCKEARAAGLPPKSGCGTFDELTADRQTRGERVRKFRGSIKQRVSEHISNGVHSQESDHSHTP